MKYIGAHISSEYDSTPAPPPGMPTQSQHAVRAPVSQSLLNTPAKVREGRGKFAAPAVRRGGPLANFAAITDSTHGIEKIRHSIVFFAGAASAAVPMAGGVLPAGAATAGELAAACSTAGSTATGSCGHSCAGTALP